MPISTDDSTDISGMPPTSAPARTPQNISADTNRKVKAKSQGQQQRGGPPGPLAALGSLAQQAGQDISGANQAISKLGQQQGFATPSGNPWNLIDWAQETAQDASATWGLTRKLANTLGGHYSDGVANVWQGHSATDWMLKKTLEAGTSINPLSMLQIAFQTIDPKGEGFDVLDVRDPQRRAALGQAFQQLGNEAGGQAVFQDENQQQSQQMEKAAQNLPGSTFDLASMFIAPEDKLAMLGAATVPPVVEAFLTGGPTDQQNALEWMVATAALSYIRLPEPMKKALIAKMPSLERVLGSAADAEKAKKEADRAASDPTKQAQQTTDWINEQVNRGAMPEQYAEKPAATARKPGQPEQLVALRDATGNIAIQESIQKRNIQALLKKIGVSDVDELVDKLRTNQITDDDTIKAIVNNWKGLGLPYDLLRYSPEESPLRDPRRWLEALPQTSSALGGKLGKPSTPFAPSTKDQFLSGQPGVLRGYRGASPGNKGQNITHFTTDQEYAKLFAQFRGQLHQVEVATDKPFVMGGSNTRRLIDKAVELGLVKPDEKEQVIEDLGAGTPMGLGSAELAKWLTDQGYDAIVGLGAAGEEDSLLGIGLDPSKVKMVVPAVTDEGKATGGLAEGHRFIVALNGYLDQIHRGVFANGADPMQSLLRSLAGDSRATNAIDQHFMSAVVDLLKGQMTESLGVKLGKAVEGDVKAYDELPVQAKMIADGWGLLRAASREEARDTDYSKSVIPNWMPRPDKLLGDVVRKRGRPSGADSLLTKDARKHRDEALMLDPKGHIVLGQNFQYVADANKALGKTRAKLVSDILKPGLKLSKELENDPQIANIRKLIPSDPAKAQEMAEVLAWQKYADKETNFLKNISRSFANQVRAIHTHSALQEFLQMHARDGRALALKAMSPRQRDEFLNQGYKLIDDPRFVDYLFHPDLATNLNRYVDHIKLPNFPEFVATDGRRLVMKPESLNQAAELAKQGYHTLDAPLFGGAIGGEKPWLFHPDVQTISDLTSQTGKYWWGKVKDAGWWYNQLLNLEGRAISAIMFSPMVHGLNIASRWGMGYMMNPREMTRYLLQSGAKPWNHGAEDLALRMEAYNAGLLPHVRNMNYADNLLSTMSDALGDIEDQLPDAFKENTKKGQLASFMDKRPRPVQAANNWFWGAVNDFGVMMYHMEKQAAMKGGMLETDAREFAARRANSWMGAVAAEDKNPLIHQTMRLLMFAPNWWRTWAELMFPLYKRAGFAADHTYVKYRAYQSAKTVAAAVAFQKLTGEILNYVATSSTPWAMDGHWQQQNQEPNKDRIEATGAWLDDIPGIDFFAPRPDINSKDPAVSAAAKRGAIRTFENPFGRQQRAIEEAAGFEEGVPYWQPQDTWDGMAKFAASRMSPLLDAAFGATNVDLYQTISDHQLRSIDTSAPAGSISPGSLLTGAIMMTPIGLQFAQNVQKNSAQGDTNPVDSALGTKIPNSVQSFVGDLTDPTARMVWSWFTGVNSPYDTAQKSRGTKPSDQDYQRVADLQKQYQQQMLALNAEALSGQMTPSQWRSAYSDLAKQHAAQMEALFKGSPDYVNGAEGLLNDYMGLYEDPRVVNKDGTINQDMLTQLQNQFRSQHTTSQLQQMDALMRQNDSKYPMLKLYHTMLDSYDKFQQQWATQNNVDLGKLHKDIAEYSALYGDTRGSQLYLRQHPELSRYERAKTAWQRTTNAGKLYGLFYGTTVGNTLLRQAGGRSGPTPTQLAERLGSQAGG